MNQGEIFFLKEIPMILFHLVKFKIALLSILPPLCLILSTLQLFRVVSLFSIFSFSASLWLILEALFYLFFLHHSQELSDFRPLNPQNHRLSKEERKELFQLALSTVDDIKQFISGWFLKTPVTELKRGNLAEFLAWAFFLSDYSLLLTQNKKEYLDEIEEMIQTIEQQFHLTFPPGYQQNVKCIRLHLDPMNPRHKPLFYYVGLWMLQSFFALVMTIMGFKKFFSRSEEQFLLTFYPNRKQKTYKVGYWYKEGTSNNEHENQGPIVFFHGIGVGLFGNLMLYIKLLKNSKRPLFLIEMPHVSSLLFPIYGKISKDVPNCFEMANTIEQMLIHHGFYNPKLHSKLPVIPNAATFVGHSLGSVVVTWMLRFKPYLVKRAVVVDPVCFLLHLPDVAYNFIYRQPTDTIHLLLWWFFSRELYISWTLARCFYWHQNALFTSKIPSHCQLTVVLGSEDVIVPSPKVRKYLLQSGFKECFIHEQSKFQLLPDHRLHLYYYMNKNHAHFVFDPKMEDDVVSIILHEPQYSEQVETISYDRETFLTPIEGSFNHFKELKNYFNTFQSDIKLKLKVY